jgi:hypothetical protein
MLTVRLTEAQAAVLDAVSERLGIEKADLTRAALDFWLQHGPEANRVRDLLAGYSDGSKT